MIINKDTQISFGCVIHSKCVIACTSVGEGTYLGVQCNLSNCQIGKYCAIAHNVEVISATHPTSKFVSIHPAFYSLKKQSGVIFTKRQRFEERKFIEKENRICVKIGNDVWIGANVTIVGGVQIGDGAVIATGAVVTKDVEPYAIVGGTPAKFIRYRFTTEQIQFLQQIQWWDKPKEWLEKNVDYFENIDDFVKLKEE